ncbi:MAG TPA: VWA domain-containing protein [Bryobacteraceae bacterium]|nr:VWA domain-containing protein [Bryobacteraceae bacterium]
MTSKILAMGAVAVYALFGQGDVLFRAQSRLVEVYATIRDHNGRYVDGLPQTRFAVSDNGSPQTIAVFESDSAPLSCAVLLDTTGSMAEVLPAVKHSVMNMIDELAADDAVAIYTFSVGLKRMQDFTSDKAAAKQAVLRSRASGQTALFDAISELAHEIEPRTGKKAIIVFTDGDDNSSTLNARAAVQRAKKAGVPVYAVAEGDALKSGALLSEIREIAETTGAKFHQAHHSGDINGIFKDISSDLGHTYLLAYKPPPAADQKWRTIALAVSGIKDAKIRAKEGYFPE